MGSLTEGINFEKGVKRGGSARSDGSGPQGGKKIAMIAFAVVAIGIGAYLAISSLSSPTVAPTLSNKPIENAPDMQGAPPTAKPPSLQKGPQVVR